jgi:O-antigen ligase
MSVDGVPKEGLQIQDVLVRIAVLLSIREKVSSLNKFHSISVACFLYIIVSLCFLMHQAILFTSLLTVIYVILIFKYGMTGEVCIRKSRHSTFFRRHLVTLCRLESKRGMEGGA